MNKIRFAAAAPLAALVVLGPPTAALADDPNYKIENGVLVECPWAPESCVPTPEDPATNVNRWMECEHPDGSGNPLAWRRGFACPELPAAPTPPVEEKPTDKPSKSAQKAAPGPQDAPSIDGGTIEVPQGGAVEESAQAPAQGPQLAATGSGGTPLILGGAALMAAGGGALAALSRKGMRR